MDNIILGLLAETSIHPGMGRSLGTVDLPVSRESTTDYPVVFGSGVKGAMRDKAEATWSAENKKTVDSIFGIQEHAGEVLFSDAKLILLPVRSLTGCYRWLTCPLILERLTRDFKRAGIVVNFEIPCMEQGYALGAGANQIILEERQLIRTGELPANLTTTLGRLMLHEATISRLEKQLLVVSDDDFAWFAKYGLQVNARNVLGENKTSENLWYEETLPPDSLFYTLISSRNDASHLDALKALFAAAPYIQLGGNETVGQGWFAIQTLAAY